MSERLMSGEGGARLFKALLDESIPPLIDSKRQYKDITDYQVGLHEGMDGVTFNAVTLIIAVSDGVDLDYANNLVRPIFKRYARMANNMGGTFSQIYPVIGKEAYTYAQSYQF